MCNPFKPEFTIVIFIHYVVAILDLWWMKMSRCRKLNRHLQMRNDDLMHREGLNSGGLLKESTYTRGSFVVQCMELLL